jgi:putative glycerol-1-phosphate prenyltransferase
LQITDKADAILLLSLISGRNAEYLIGNHVVAAPLLKKSGLEIISTGYILVDGGKHTSVEYMSQTSPIPADKPDIVVATAMAGEMLGNDMTYLEAGSGAEFPVPSKTIREVKNNISIPLIVGGGIRTPEDLKNVYNAGADIAVVGSAIEKSHAQLAMLATLKGN